MTAALVMAGGRGDRMRATGSPTPKPLVPVAGISLLERNLLTLLQSGFRDITVAVPAHTPEIGQFVTSGCQPVAARFGVHLHLFEETQPLGNIGAAAALDIPPDDQLLVVYADNLTSLDLNALLDHHRRFGAALTSAVHYESFRIPFGEVVVEGGRIVAYREKPERRVLVSSGLFVLSQRAVACLPRGQQVGVSWLANQLLTTGEVIAAYPHEAPWVDVNDLASVRRAEQLIADHAEAFELLRLPLQHVAGGSS